MCGKALLFRKVVKCFAAAACGIAARKLGAGSGKAKLFRKQSDKAATNTKLYRATRAPPPFITRRTSFNPTVVVSPGVVIASAP